MSKNAERSTFQLSLILQNVVEVYVCWNNHSEKVFGKVNKSLIRLYWRWKHKNTLKTCQRFDSWRNHLYQGHFGFNPDEDSCINYRNFGKFLMCFYVFNASRAWSKFCLSKPWRLWSRKMFGKVILNLLHIVVALIFSWTCLSAAFRRRFPVLLRLDA